MLNIIAVISTKDTVLYVLVNNAKDVWDESKKNHFRHPDAGCAIAEFNNNY